MSFSSSPLTTSIDSSTDYSTKSDDSAATQLAPSSSEAMVPVTPNSSPAASLSAIRYEERIFLTGATRSGKSTLAKELFLSTAAPRMVIDPAGSDLTASVTPPGGTFSDPKRVPDLATVRFVPSDPDDRDAYDALYKWAFDRFPRYVWLDEAGIAAPAAGYPKQLNKYLVQGAKRMLGHLACHTRPREVCKNLLAQASHVFIFNLPNPDDRRYVAEVVGIPPATLENLMRSLPRFGFLHWSGPQQELTVYEEGLAQ